ncbi:MAG TPA: aminotransferase class IV, partial [Bacillota bacterium]
MSELTVFLNGRFVPYEQAVIPVEDRAFLFADGVYEVIPCYGGRPFRLELHLERLRQSATALEIRLPYPLAEFERIVHELIRLNNLSDASVYLQVSRGVAPRNHLFPEGAQPTVVGIARPFTPPSDEELERGVRAITAPDNRWGICYIKTVGLLPNVLARQAAHRRGADEAILVRDGLVTEGTASNVFCVLDGIVYTHPLANILPGITRTTVLEI